MLDAVAPAAGLTDLFVLSHGWNNDMADARALYSGLCAELRTGWPAHGSARCPGARSRVLGVFWPSKKFADKDLIPGGAASLGAAAAAGRPALPAAALVRQLDRLKGAFDHPQADQLIEQAKTLAPSLENSPAAQAQFADLLRKLPGRSAGSAEDASDQFFAMSGPDLIKRLVAPATPAVPGAGGPAGEPRAAPPGVPGSEAGPPRGRQPPWRAAPPESVTGSAGSRAARSTS